MAVIFGSVGAFALIVAIVAVCCVSHLWVFRMRGQYKIRLYDA